MIPMAKRLEFEVTNNQAEYEACIFGLEALRSVGAENVTVYGDSMLVVKQASKRIGSQRRQVAFILGLLGYYFVVLRSMQIYPSAERRKPNSRCFSYFGFHVGKQCRTEC